MHHAWPVAIAAATALFAATPAPAAATVFTVNSKGSEDDANVTSATALDGICDTDTTADTDCTLRAAIQEANAHAGADGIAFNKTDSGSDPDDVAFEAAAPAASVTIAGPFPTITGGVGINAGDCHDFDPFDPTPPPTPCASLNSNLTVDSTGEVSVSGLAMSATIDVVSVTGSSPSVPDFTLQNTWFGLDTLGAKVSPPSTALFLEDVNGADIGGFLEGQANLFARQGTGIDILGADNTTITNNRFGVLPDGSFARAGEGASANGTNIAVLGNTLPNPDDPAEGTLIGESSAFDVATPACDGQCNLIAAAGMSATNIPQSNGIGIALGSLAHGTIIRGNQIGFSGGAAGIKGFNTVGIDIGASVDTQIGGPALDADRNVVNGNEITGLAAQNLLVQGNYLGLDATGNSTAVDGFATTVSLGGNGSVLDNHILSAGNFPALLLGGSTGSGFVVRRNVFGEGVDGNAQFVGTPVIKVTGNGDTIGGTGVGDGNVISDRTNFATAPNSVGIQITGDDNNVLGNQIGVGSAGEARPLIDGIELATDADGNVIGGNTAAAENVISNAVGDAIQITGATSDGNEIDRNTGAANGDLFIDLGNDGFGNLADPDGPNAGAQAPTITSASGTTATGTAVPGAVVRVFTKANATNGALEGFLAQATANGLGAWQATFATQPDGKLIAATSTVVTDTSELSTAAAVDAAAPQTQIDSGPAAGSSTADSTPSFGFSADDAGASFECRIDGAAFAACSGPGATHTPAALGDGPHAFEVRGRDAVGNADATPASRGFTVDTVPPETTITKRPNARTTKRVATFKFSSDEAGSTFKCKLDRGTFKPCSTPFRKKVKLGKHTFRVRATDSAGNTDTTPAKARWKVRK